MTFGIYLVDFIILIVIVGLALGAYLVRVPSMWIGVGVIILVDLGVMMGVATTRTARSIELSWDDRQGLAEGRGMTAKALCRYRQECTRSGSGPTLTQVCTCGAPRKYQSILGLSSCQTSHTPSFPMSRFL